MKADTKELIFPMLHCCCYIHSDSEWESIPINIHLQSQSLKGALVRYLNFHTVNSKQYVQPHFILTVRFCSSASLLQSKELDTAAERSALLYRLECSRVNLINLSSMRDNRCCSI